MPVLIAAVLTAARLWNTELREPWGYMAVAAALWVVALCVVKFVAASDQDKREAPEVTHQGIQGCVSALHAAVCYLRAGDVPQASDIRATFHRVVPPLETAREIEQIIPYVGGDGGGAGRRFSINTGVTGRAIRDGEPYILSSSAETEAKQRAELKSDLGYTAAEVRALTPGRYSAMAVPIRGKGGLHVLGVIYLDSSGRNVFDDESVTGMILAICDSIDGFVTQRYQE
ncbi:GAF domain-containing protein [Verticiella sediminum]|uniref:GAF domain-containing protein n=1 Tax=Verticiella sediminum TaxID=1247510 RepID=UPI001FE51DE9|nr:GAF domain-containing protein [Verticiella sediminum]